LLLQRGGRDLGSQLTWFDRSGKELGSLGNAGQYSNPHIQANGKAVAYDLTDPGNQNTDVWTNDLQGSSPKRLTFDPALDTVPVWSPDGKSIVFTSSRGTAFDLYLKDANGAQEEKAICESGEDKYPTSWSRDGKYILYSDGPDLKYLTLPVTGEVTEKKMTSTLFLKAAATLKNGVFSPDGKWVAYGSTESGRWEVYVTSFPEAKGKWQVSNNGGSQPRWRADGKELFYLSADAKIMSVPVKIGASFDPGTPSALFQTNPKDTAATSEQFFYDASPDGQKFLVNNTPTISDPQPLTVVLHWSPK
jgi:eukaryotic-like serine/threonine-protein kinase